MNKQELTDLIATHRRWIEERESRTVNEENKNNLPSDPEPGDTMCRICKQRPATLALGISAEKAGLDDTFTGYTLMVFVCDECRGGVADRFA
ncbi:MAG: hypothetical protein KF753_18350 [Caldilineaceae bacterium]|nr:hypothetical protein [Caldilineaceae bacterium]